MAGISFDEDELRPLVRAVVAEALAELERLKKIHDGRLAYTEAEAASMLGLNQHQLRDLRLDGKIGYSRIVGNKIRYMLQNLMDYLNRGRVEIE